MQKRRSPRVIKRLEVRFTTGEINYTGITSNLSKEGIFIRTQKGLPPQTIIEIELYLASGKAIKLRGQVKRTIKTPFQAIKNGMGIELINPPREYIEFLKTLQ